MGVSSSGFLDETKITSIKGLVSSSFQSFSVFYRQQYSAAYFGHLHQEVEPKKEGRGLLLKHGPPYAPEEVLYQGSVKFSCCDDQGKKFRERCVVIRRDYKVEIHENMETFCRGCAAKLVLQTAGGSVFTTEEESRVHLAQTYAALFTDVKEDSSLVVSPPDTFGAYLHLPFMGLTCFLFQQEGERDHFLSALKTCIRHCNLDPWCDPSYECQAYIRALRLYRQNMGYYEYWEMLLGTEEKVLASQVMEEVLPWLQSQLQSRVKGKKTESIRQWLATLQATYILVLEQVTASLEALREECRLTASATQALIRSNLDQIVSSSCFLEEKIRACVWEEAEKECSESVAPYMSSIIEVLTDNLSAGIQAMQRTLHTQMDSIFTQTPGETGEIKEALSTLRSISLDPCYRQVENLTEKLEGLKQRFGLSSTQRLVHSAHLEMEKLLDSAVHTFELFLQSSARLQPSHIPMKMERAKERVLKQLDYDSRVVQRRLYQEALLEITLPVLIKTMDSKWKTELQQLEQYIFSDYSSFILVHNVYDDVLRNILSEEIETAVQDAASKRVNNFLLDSSDLAMSQYSLLGQTPPRSAPGSPPTHTRDSPLVVPREQPSPAVEGTAAVSLQGDSRPNDDAKSDPSTPKSSEQSTVLQSPSIIVTQQIDESLIEEARGSEETRETVQPGNDTPPTTDETSVTATPDSDVGQEVGTSHADASPGSINPILNPADLSMCPLSSPRPSDAPPECTPISTSEQTPENQYSVQHSCPTSSLPPYTGSPMKISLEPLSDAIGCNSAASVMQTNSTDRAVYLTGKMKDNWEMERVKQERWKEAHERIKEGKEETEGEGDGEERGGGKIESIDLTRDEPVDEGCWSSESPAGSATILNTGQRENSEEDGDDEGRELETEKGKDDDEEADNRGGHVGKGGKSEREEEALLQSPQPMESQSDCGAELPVDSVAVIRQLVTEITEVETVITPRPDSSYTP